MVTTQAPSRDAILARLDRVTDPELDRSIVELEYIDALDIEDSTDAGGAHVGVDLLLPTAWCSPAFAWMMGVDAREAVESLPSVDRATIRFLDHMHATELDPGVNGDLSFADAFPDAEDEVAAVRAVLDDKARMARQFDAIEALVDAGLTGEQVATLTVGELVFDEVGEDDRVAIYLADESFAVSVPAEPLRRYLEKARAVDVVTDDDDRLFRTPEGDAFDPPDFELVRQRSRLARVNMSGQGGVCDALGEQRRAAHAGRGRGEAD